MKKIFLMALTALAIVSCAKENVSGTEDNVGGEKNVTIVVKFEPSKKSIEDPSAGNDRDKVKAEVKDLQILAYDAGGAMISKLNITKIADLRKALNGNGVIVGDTDNSPLAGTGLVVGVPSNVARMDIMANFSTADVTTNVNDYQGFSNTPLVSTDYLRYISDTKNQIPGKLITKRTGTTADPHTFETTISSSGARFEIKGSIPMKDEVVYTNAAGKRYIFDKGTSTYLEEGTDPYNTYVAANPQEAGNFVKYFPNGYYAVDVEEIFINNIYIRGGATNSAYGLVNPGKVPEDPTDPENDGDRDKWYREHFCGSGMNDKNSGHGYDPRSDHAMMMWQNLKAKGGENYITATPAREFGIQKGKVVAFNFYQQGMKTTGARVVPPITDSDINAGMNATPGSDAYNKFLNSVRLYGAHIVLRVKCYASKDDYDNKKFVPGKEFITIRSFSMNSATPITGICGSNGIIYEFLRNYIFRLDLSDLQDSFKPNNPTTPDVPPVNPVDPDPEDEEANVSVKVQVLDWTIINVKPVV